MTERETWLYLAKQFRQSNLEPAICGNNNFWTKTNTAHEPCLGLCNVLYDLYNKDEITKDIRKKVLIKIRKFKHKQFKETGRYLLYIYPTTKYGARCRVKFCLQHAKSLQRGK